jgi:TFIIF-interacting CTD phosphatase-like protein
LIRPFAKEFLCEMNKFFELVIFTASVKEYADWILEKLDP